MVSCLMIKIMYFLKASLSFIENVLIILKFIFLLVLFMFTI